MVEMIVALIVGALTLQLALSTAAALARLGRRLDDRSEVVRAMAVAEAVLRDEVRRGESFALGDSLLLRAVRGVGIACGPGEAADEVVVAWRGARLPDPRKDSVEFVTSEGQRVFSRLTRSALAAHPCDIPGRYGTPRVVQTDPAAPPGTVLMRVFERGSYHLADPALRYRSGRGGRQPLTAPVFDAGASGFTAGDATVGVDLVEGMGTPEGTLRLDPGSGARE